jgi:ABC-type glycerol-3-phosphate transport system permease component
MANARLQQAQTNRFRATKAAYADLFTIGCALVLVGTSLWLYFDDNGLDYNLNIVLTAFAGAAFGLIGLYNPSVSRWTSLGAAFVGLNGVFYYLTIYADACTFSGTMTAIFWISALATGGLFGQVVIGRENKVIQRAQTSRRTGNSRARKLRGRVSTGSVVLYTTMIFFSVIALVPFMWMISTSFMTLGETINRTWVPAQMQVCNYYEAWETANFSSYFRNSILIAIATISGLLLVTILSAYAFARIQFVGRSLIFTALLATLMVPEIVVMIPNYLTVSGQILPIPVTTGETLQLTTTAEAPFVALQGVDIGTGRDFTWIDTLAALSLPFMGSAFAIFLLRQFFMQIPNDLWEAARIDGAGHLRFLVQIVVPISRAPILTVTLLTFIASWNSLLWPLLVTRDPDMWRPISYGLQAFNDEAGTSTHLATAGATITILPMLVLYFMTQKTFTEGIATTGLKG